MPNSDEWLPYIGDRVPQTVDEAKRRKRVWLMTASEASITGLGYYRREMDMRTARSAEPTYTATWHPINGAVVNLARASNDQAYYACVRHYQEEYNRRTWPGRRSGG